MRVALVYDRINKFGGAERVLLSLHKIWPQAPLYTAVYDRQRTAWSCVFEIKPSFINKLPFIASRHEAFPYLMPYTFESFDFSGFDVVISVTSAEAKGIITNPQTLHICYCLTPTRYLWSGYTDYIQEPGAYKLNRLVRFIMRFSFPYLREWDFIASMRPDKYIAISETVKHRIAKYYHQDSVIIYPPVDTDKFIINRKQCKYDYFLIVSRLVPYKKIDFVISAFNKLGWRLKIIGNGIDEKRLKNMAKKNIEFIPGNLTDGKLCCYYQNCRALIFPGEEDFGIAAVEAQACGKPVIGYGIGGIGEIIIPGKTGEIFLSQDEICLTAVLEDFSPTRYPSSVCRTNALRYSVNRFQEKIKETVSDYWTEWKKNI